MPSSNEPTPTTPHTDPTVATGLTSHTGGRTDSTPHGQEGVVCCSHHEMNIERWIVAYLCGGLLVFTTTIMRWFDIAPAEVITIPAAIGAVLLGLGLVYASFKELLRGQPSSSTLAALAIIAAIAIGKFETAGYVAFILLVFDYALRRTAWGAQRAIEELVSLTPDIARRIKPDGTEEEVGIASLKVGDLVRVRPGENLPVDGEVTKGESSINQASLTGEAMPVEAQRGSLVYAGTTNLTGTVEVRVTTVGEDTTIGKVTALIREAEASRSEKQLMIEKVAKFFVPIALVTSGLVWWLTNNIESAITVLVAVCPSALLISSPTAMMAAFAAAARLGIMVKKTSVLEAAADVDTIVFDKTGTLTTGRFAVSRLAPADGVTGAELLQAAADAEQHSNHPLALSIMHTARQARITPAADEGYEEIHGNGVRTKAGNTEILAGRARWLVTMTPGIEPALRAVEAKIEGMSGVHIVRGGRYLGAVGLEDRLRYNAKTVVEHLRELGARSISVFTGDRLAVAKRVGVTVGVDNVEAECLPEEKHELISRLVKKGNRVLMVGDGINDGPSLAAADVGVAMGLHGSDIATNSAGVALMTDDIGRVPFLVALARKTRAVIAQNLIASVIIAIVGLALAATGRFEAVGGLGAAALYHFVADIFVIANSFRLIRFGEEFAATEAGSPGAASDAELTSRPITGAAPA
ncbi:MAG: heavy metal translocating P-type ATPase [Phycisphaerales bacterium]